MNALDRLISVIAPRWGLQRVRARVAAELVQRNYEAVSTGRRTNGWNRSGADANAASVPALAGLRTAARDLVRNNGHAKAGLDKIVDHVVGWGITAKPHPANAAALAAWQQWAESTECDSDGRLDFAGIQRMAMRTVAQDGEVLIRRRFRRPEDGLSIPLQLQLLEADYLDSSKTEQITNASGQVVGRIIAGVEYDLLGRRVAYWLYPQHPGDVRGYISLQSRRVPAESILHVYQLDRPGQVRGVSWFAPVLVKFKEFDGYSDATLMKQRIAACLAIAVTDQDGSGAPIGTVDDTGLVDEIEPGAVLNLPPGRSVTTIDPPTVNEYGAYSAVTLHEIAAGLGIAYEDLTGDFSKVNFSSARMARLRAWPRIEAWRWNMLVPQLCGPVWAWAMEAAAIMGRATAQSVRWTAPPMPMIEPDKEGLAYMRNVRAGLQTLPEVLRERGYDPDEVLQEFAAANKRLDELGLVLDSDPRKMTQAGQLQAVPKPEPPADEKPDPPDPAQDDEADADAERAHRERLALIEAVSARARQPITVQVAPGAVAVDARTTVAEGALRVEAPTTIADGAIRLAVADGAVRVDASTLIEAGAFQSPVTIAEGATRVEAPIQLTLADVMNVAAPADGVKVEQVGVDAQ